MRKALAPLLLLLLVACTAPGRQQPAAPEVNLSGYPPAFRDGYLDGCASAGGRHKQNAERFKSDPQYSMGWRDGLDICKRRRS